MIKILRHIRKSLLIENKTGKYFKYAIGEITLVMIGILLALQVNNWNENRIEREIEHNYVKILVQDLSEDGVSLDELVSLSNESVDSKNIILAYQEGNITEPDSLGTHFLRAVFNGITNFVPNKGAINEIQNAGGLSLIKNEVVRNQILNLYNEYDNVEKNVGSNYLRNRLAMRDLVYSKANGNLFLTFKILDKEILYPLLRDSEIRNRLVNNWAVSYNNRLKELSEINAQTIRICKDYLLKF